MCASALILSVSLMMTASRADEPNRFSSQSISNQDRGELLIQSLRSRSASERWLLLRKERELRQQLENTRKNSTSGESVPPAEIGGNLPAPILSKPFPTAEQIQQKVFNPEPLDLNPLSEQPALPEFREPIPIAQSKTEKVPRPKTAETPEQLRKITEILPYHDYSPETFSKKAPGNKLPEEKWTTKPYVPRNFENVLFTWEATNLYHNPLYFEDPALERYGHTYPDYIQPFASAGRFGVQLLGLPYQMTIDPIRKKDYTLGWYRPGECAPKLLYQIPWNKHAAAVQAGVTTGMFFLIP
ncbi:MAG: hypothetical protein Tsb009_03330 [Planctomycetaceae bacterium]